jgi:uncharacterized phage-associated protein
MSERKVGEAVRMPERKAVLVLAGVKMGGAHVRDVAAYVLDRCGPMTAMKLQKLCYYVYGHHLAWEERRLFPEPFEAWANGPVCPALYALHRGRLEIQSGEIDGNPAALDAGEIESCNLVLDTYCRFTAHQLSMMTHRETPWVLARRRSHAKPLERTNELLRDEDIFEFFDALTSADAQQG